MKIKVLFLIVGIALFAVAIGFGINDKKEASLTVKNIEALASHGGMGLSGGCSGNCDGDECKKRYDTMVESGQYYCCAVYNFWRGKQCDE